MINYDNIKLSNLFLQYNDVIKSLIQMITINYNQLTISEIKQTLLVHFIFQPWNINFRNRNVFVKYQT